MLYFLKGCEPLGMADIWPLWPPMEQAMLLSCPWLLYIIQDCSRIHDLYMCVRYYLMCFMFASMPDSILGTADGAS